MSWQARSILTEPKQCSYFGPVMKWSLNNWWCVSSRKMKKEPQKMFALTLSTRWNKMLCLQLCDFYSFHLRRRQSILCFQLLYFPCITPLPSFSSVSSLILQNFSALFFLIRNRLDPSLYISQKLLYNILSRSTLCRWAKFWVKRNVTHFYLEIFVVSCIFSSCSFQVS